MGVERIHADAAKILDIGTLGAPNYLCPADISNSLRARLIDLTRRAAETLDVRDVGRVDFRIGVDNEPYLLEINTLPGFNPQLSDLCLMASAEGMPYNTLITEILYLAAERNKLPYILHPGSPFTEIPVTTMIPKILPKGIIKQIKPNNI